jgi:hypothetical protein
MDIITSTIHPYACFLEYHAPFDINSPTGKRVLLLQYVSAILGLLDSMHVGEIVMTRGRGGVRIVS